MVRLIPGGLLVSISRRSSHVRLMQLHAGCPAGRHKNSNRPNGPGEGLLFQTVSNSGMCAAALAVLCPMMSVGCIAVSEHPPSTQHKVGTVVPLALLDRGAALHWLLLHTQA